MAALDIADDQQRQAYLEQSCGGEAERVCEIQRLLAAHHDGAASPVDLAVKQLGPAETRATDADVSLEFNIASHPTIDRYKLLEQIGEGGMGTVFMAQQNEPIKRKVALKLIKPGMDSREVISRFQAERQALAMMDHPNIARVFDAGTTAQEALSKVGLDGMRRMIREDDPPRPSHKISTLEAQLLTTVSSCRKLGPRLLQSSEVFA